MTDDTGSSESELPPSERVVERVAQREDVDPTELREPLDAVVDPGALDDIFAPRLDGKPRRGGRVIFEYYEYTVTVEADGTIELESS